MLAIPPFAEGLGSIISFIMLYWYVFLLIGAVIIIILLFVKVKRLEEKKHDEIKAHHDKLSKEEKFNMIPYKFLNCGKRTLGKIKSKKIKQFEFTVKSKDKFGKETKKIDKTINFAVFTIADKSLGFGENFSIWTGETHITIPDGLLKYDNEKEIILIPQDIDLELYRGYILPSNFEHENARRFVDHEFAKSEMDYEINAHASQLIKMSNLDVAYGHQIEKLEKEKEVEEAKKSRKIIG